MFLDHVHPTIDGHRMLALAVIDTMSNTQLLTTASTWNQTAIEQVSRRVESRIDQQAHGDALRNLAKVLTWAGKTEEANRAALKADRLMPNTDVEAIYLAGNALLQSGKIEEAIPKYEAALRLNPDHIGSLNALGAAYFQSKQRSRAIETWKRVLEIDPRLPAVHNNLRHCVPRSARL